MKLVNGPFDGKDIPDPGGSRIRMTVRTPDGPVIHEYAPDPKRTYAIHLGARPVKPT